MEAIESSAEGDGYHVDWFFETSPHFCVPRPFARLMRLQQMMKICRWSDFANPISRLQGRQSSGKTKTKKKAQLFSPFVHQDAKSFKPSIHYVASRIFILSLVFMRQARFDQLFARLFVFYILPLVALFNNQNIFSVTVNASIVVWANNYAIEMFRSLYNVREVAVLHGNSGMFQTAIINSSSIARQAHHGNTAN